MPQPQQYIFVKQAFEKVKSHPELSLMVTGRWVTDGTLYLLVKGTLDKFNSHLKDLSKRQFNRCMILHPAFKDQITRQKNDVGLYRLIVGKEIFYWIGDNPKFPRPVTDKWKSQVLATEARVFAEHADADVWKGSPAKRPRDDDASVAQSNTARAADMDEDGTSAKRPRQDDASVAQSNTARAAEMNEDGTLAKRPRRKASDPPVKPAHIQQQTYWDSPEASIQFIPREEDASVLECIERRILLLSKANASPEGFRLVVDGGDPDDLCSSNEVFRIRNRCALRCVKHISLPKIT
jgi:hypothetical protein